MLEKTLEMLFVSRRKKKVHKEERRSSRTSSSLFVFRISTIYFLFQCLSEHRGYWLQRFCKYYYVLINYTNSMPHKGYAADSNIANRGRT